MIGVSFNDWFLPSKDALNAMYTELYLYGIGSFTNGYYWSSSEGDSDDSYRQYFSDGTQVNGSKSAIMCVRACHTFTSTTNYNLRDIGPAGGWIFWKSGNDYLESAPEDQSISHWSNIIHASVGTTG